MSTPRSALSVSACAAPTPARQPSRRLPRAWARMRRAPPLRLPHAATACCCVRARAPGPPTPARLEPLAAPPPEPRPAPARSCRPSLACARSCAVRTSTLQRTLCSAAWSHTLCTVRAPCSRAPLAVRMLLLLRTSTCHAGSRHLSCAPPLAHARSLRTSSRLLQSRAACSRAPRTCAPTSQRRAPTEPPSARCAVRLGPLLARFLASALLPERSYCGMEKRGRGKPVEIRRKSNRKVLPMWRKGRAPGKGKAEKEK
jgi:hypothetical protein